MKRRVEYHKSFVKDFIPDRDISFTETYTSSDGLRLNATLFNKDTNVGVIIIPGIWYPREAFYKLAGDLNRHYKVMVYDQRGHSYSEGGFNLTLMADDLLCLVSQYLQNENIDHLFVVGHSLGGYISIQASSKMDFPQLLGQATLAPPISLTSTMKKIPASITPFKIYLMNLLRAKAPKYRGRMVREYVSFWYPAFRKKPYLFALRAERPDKVIDNIMASASLPDITPRIKIQTLFLWGDNDTTLGIRGRYPPVYQDYIESVMRSTHRFETELLAGMSHQFNYDDKRRISIGEDNDLLSQKIIGFIEKGLLSRQ